jgi:membrane protein DedA with SNARE-associated domain
MIPSNRSRALRTPNYLGCVIISALPPALLFGLMFLLWGSGMSWERQRDGGNFFWLKLLLVPLAIALARWWRARRKRHVAFPIESSESE